MRNTIPPSSSGAAITGIGELKPRPISDRTLFEMYADASRIALKDAGLGPREVDGLLVGPTRAGTPMALPTHLADYLGLRPSYADVVDLGGATGAGMVWRAAAAIAAGQARHVLCVAGETVGDWSMSVRDWVGLPRTETDRVYGLPGASVYAMVADKHAKDFGTTDEQRAAVVVAQRRNGADNELALFREQVTIEDVLSGPYVSTPLRELECVQLVSGAVAFVVSAGDAVVDRPRKGAWLTGFAERINHASATHMEDLVRTTGADTARRAFAMAGISAADVDVAEIYDCFTITVIVALEDAGFCAKGEGGAFVEDADFGPTSKLPLNTNGGQLTTGQCANGGGVTHVIQAVRQLRGDAGAPQVPGCEIAFVNGNGGWFSEQCTLILTGDKA